jgi:hypothetical protein
MLSFVVGNTVIIIILLLLRIMIVVRFLREASLADFEPGQADRPRASRLRFDSNSTTIYP